MNNCEKLRQIWLQNGTFSFANELWAQNPLPTGLRKLLVKGALFTNGRKVLSQEEFGGLTGGWYDRNQCKMTCERYGVMDAFQDYVSDSDANFEAEDQQGESEDQNYIPQKAVQG